MEISNLSEAELVKEFQRGSKDCFYLLVSKLEANLFQLLKTLADSPAEAESVLNELFVRSYRRLSAGEEVDNIKVWIFQLAIETLAHHRNQPVGNSAFSEPDEHSFPKAVAVESEGEKAEMVSAIGSLPEEYKLVFILRDVNKLSIAEVSDILSVKKEMVKARLHRARLMLLKQMRELGDTTDNPCHPDA